MSKQTVTVGMRIYDLELGDDGRWIVSRGGIPTGYLHVLANGESAAYPLSQENEGEELVSVLEAAKKESWWK
ncbi:MAG: hypothetical protein ACRELY_27640 [Polyangiaceae bacterium]